MGAAAMVVTLSAFVVAPLLPSQHGPGSPHAVAARAGSRLHSVDVADNEVGPSSWTPQAPVYSTGSILDYPVTMSDGTILRADVYYPTVFGTTTPAEGRFPVLLQQTPYGKEFIVYAAALAQTNVDYLVDRGFIVVIADVRGTGDSGGNFDLFDPVQSTDGVTLAKWAATLPNSDGQVGLFGESYMGINQFQTVEAAGPDSPIKAIFPM
jgi:predicted acyl esterase